MLLIKSLDPAAHLEFSEWTAQWWVSARIEVSNGAILTSLTSLTSHRDTPETAVFAFLDNLRAIPVDQVLVTHSMDRKRRRHYRWNGAAFVEEPREVAV